MKTEKGIPGKEPRIINMSDQKMAVLRVEGDPNTVTEKYLPALYGTVYPLKMGLKTKGKDFKVEKPRARWPKGVLEVPKDEWIGLYALPIPKDTKVLPLQKKVTGAEIKIETWKYGSVAEVLYIGPYSEEGATIKGLHKFIDKNGYRIVGDHEEVYLSDPRRTPPERSRTIIRYCVEKV